MCAQKTANNTHITNASKENIKSCAAMHMDERRQEPWCESSNQSSTMKKRERESEPSSGRVKERIMLNKETAEKCAARSKSLFHTHTHQMVDRIRCHAHRNCRLNGWIHASIVFHFPVSVCVYFYFHFVRSCASPEPKLLLFSFDFVVFSSFFCISHHCRWN